MTDLYIRIFMAIFTVLLGYIVTVLTKIKNDAKGRESRLATELLRDNERIEVWRESMSGAMLGLLLQEINKSQTFYMRQGFCPVSEKRIINGTFARYKALGGNGDAERLVRDILRLPDYLK